MKNIVALLFLFLVCLGVQAQPIQRNYFTTNVNPQLNITNGNLISTNIYVSNLYATNITVNNITNLNTFNGKTTITTNLYVTNAFISYLTNNTFYTTNVTEQFVTNELSYITNLYGPFITNNTLYSTNIYVTNLTANYITNDTSYITNLYVSNIFNSTAYITNLYTSNAYITNLTANYITNDTSYITNLYVSNAFFTNLTVEFITNDFLFTTNLYTSNAFITNLTANYITNNTLITTNAYISNAFITNITIFEAQWDTNKWVGPTNDIDFSFGTYQKFLASTDMEITGLKGVNPTNENTTVLLLDPGGANRTLYFPNNWTNYTLDKGNAYTIGSTNIAIVTLSQYGQENTNVLVRIWGVIPTAQVWTNDNGVVHTVPASTPVSVGGITANNALGIGGTLTDTDSDNFASFTYHVSGTDVDPYGFVFNLNDGGLLLNTNVGTIGLLFESNVRSDGVGVLWGGDDHGSPDASGHIGMMAANVGIGAGEQAGVVGYSKTTASSQYSTVGTVIPNTDNQTNVGVIGIAATGGHPGKFSAGRFQLFSTAGTHPFPMSAAVVADSGDVALPEQKWATNNGTVTATMSGGTLTAHGVVDDAFAANGVVTNDSTGLLHTTPTLPSTLLPTDLAYTDKNNAFTTASSNYVAMTVTTSTNQNQVTPDFSIPEQLMSTNAAFKFLAPVGVDATKTTVQWTLVNVTNTTAAAVLITSPDNCHTVGTAYVTNLTAVWFQCYAQKFTNAFYIPVF